MKAFSDLVATALRCDLTRAVSLTWADHGGSAPYAMPLPQPPGAATSQIRGEVHATAHLGPGGYAAQGEDRHLVHGPSSPTSAQALDATVEGAGTALDNSLLVMGNAQAEGSTHRVDDIPFILVGGAGGAAAHGAHRARGRVARHARSTRGPARRAP